MRIAFISSEFSGLPGSGGIGTYFLHAARCLAGAGHEVEVFTSGTPGQLHSEKGIVFHQLGAGWHPGFAIHVAEALTARHREAPFDLLESAELKAEGLHAAWANPDIAHVVRIHSPSVVLNRYLDLPLTGWEKLQGIFQQARIAFGAWRQGSPVPPVYFETRPPLWFPTTENEERDVAARADLVIVMNGEMRRLVRDYWWINQEVIREVPNPLRMPLREAVSGPVKKQTYRLGFAGRLEPRKGLIELARALQEILPRHPDWEVAIAGRPVLSCLSGVDPSAIAREQLKMFGSRVQFLGALPPGEMEGFLEGLDLYVFPSLWDNFPYAVIEAMGAGKAIIASRTGAVVEMLDQGRCGMLVDPGNVAQLIQALDALMSDAGRRQMFGESALVRAHSVYSEQQVTAAILEAYRFALERKERRLRAAKGTGAK